MVNNSRLPHEMHAAALRANKFVVGAFFGATFLSAALVFLIQPMFTRFVLPILGGSPGVWSVAMVFFQAVLFAGYLYAHVLAKVVSGKRAVAAHICVTTAAILALPLGIARGWGEPPTEGEAVWLLGLFAMSIGAPYFALSANGPLLQAWYVRTTHDSQGNPYLLYAVSNAGSFLALLAYPLVIEPTMTIAGQSRLWTVGYLLLALLIAVCGSLVWMSSQGAAKSDANPVAQPPMAELVRWTILAAVPTALLIAVTAQISTDIAAIPLVWVVPLAIYLATLVLVFGSWPAQVHRLVAQATPWALLALVGVMVLLPESNLEGWRFFAELGLHLGAFLLVALMCHGELANRRPGPSQLTIFYLSMSFGGMLGGIFASLVAPQIFSWVAEYPLLIVAAALCRPAIVEPRWAGSRHVRVGAGLAASIILVPGLLGYGSLYQSPIVISLIGLGCVVAAVRAVQSRVLFAAALATALLAVRLYPPEGSTTLTFRSFFGVHKVHESEDGRHRLLLHGTTVHGAQRIKTDTGEPETGRPEPLTYYRVGSPIHDVLNAARINSGGGLRIGAVGLGAGSMACLVGPQDQLTFFEIDTTVVRIARDPRLFTFLSHCRSEVPIVIGDARLTLAQSEDAGFDVIVIDAFASDAIPTHLLTREALGLYARKLAPGGIIALHLSSRHMELASVAHSVAASAGLVSRGKEEDLPEEAIDGFRFDSTVVAVARRKEDIAGLTSSDEWEDPSPRELSVTPWTDDYANPLGAIWRHIRG